MIEAGPPLELLALLAELLHKLDRLEVLLRQYVEQLEGGRVTVTPVVIVEAGND